MPPDLRYYALSAASAVFKYVEIKLNTQFSSGSLRIRYAPVEGTMMIDPETARNLEIVDNMGNARSPHSLFGYVFPSFAEEYLLLLRVVNHCSTAMARRLLRANLLAPVTGTPQNRSAQTTLFPDILLSWIRTGSTTGCRRRYSGSVDSPKFRSHLRQSWSVRKTGSPR